jgi:hypothetical protein
VSLAIAICSVKTTENNDIEIVKTEALKRRQAIVASLEGMKNILIARFIDLRLTPKMLILGKKDPVLGRRNQISN